MASPDERAAVLATLEIPDRVRQLADAVARKVRSRLGPEARVVWFGSWARGDARRSSDIDIDIAIDAPSGILFSDYVALRAWVDELPTLYSIDLVDLGAAGESLRREVEERGVEL